MLQANSDLIMSRLQPTDRVLDIGGWAHPFNRANFVMDAEPFDTRGYYNRTFARKNPFPPIGGNIENFSRDTWIQRDICEKTPFPFGDKELNYVICSHTLEDIRDPLWVCSEIIRISKAGYIEVPSRLMETCRGAESGIAGLSHHRWLIDISRQRIQFLQKFHRLHNRRYSLPKSVANRLSSAQRVQWLFWERDFDYSETMLHGEDQLNELKRFVDTVRPYPSILVQAENAVERISHYWNRAIKHVSC